MKLICTTCNATISQVSEHFFETVMQDGPLPFCRRSCMLQHRKLSGEDQKIARLDWIRYSRQIRFEEHKKSRRE